LSLLSSEALLDMGIISMFDVTVLSLMLMVRVLLWKNFAVLDRLNGGVVVVLMNLTVYGLCDILVLSAGDILVLDCWVDSLIS